MIEIKHICTGDVLLTVQADSLTGQAMTGTHLPYADFSGCVLERIDLRNADLRHANFSGALGEHANFHGTCLSEANLEGAELAEAEFTDTYIRGANFERARLVGAPLPLCPRARVRFSRGRSFERRLEHVGASLQSQRGESLRGRPWAADFSGADSTDADLTGANLAGAKLTGAKMNRAHLEGATDSSGRRLKGKASKKKSWWWGK